MIDYENLAASLWAFAYCALLVILGMAASPVLPHWLLVILAVFVLPFLATIIMVLVRRAAGRAGQ